MTVVLDDYSVLLAQIESALQYPDIPVSLLRDALRSLKPFVPTKKYEVWRDCLVIKSGNGCLKLISGNEQETYAIAINGKFPGINLCKLPFTPIRQLMNVVCRQDKSATVAINQTGDKLTLRFSFGGVYNFYGLDCGTGFSDIEFTKEIVMNWESETPDWKRAEINKQSLASQLLVEEISLLTPTAFARMAKSANVQTSRVAWIKWVKAGNVHEHLSVSWEAFSQSQSKTNELDALVSLSNTLSELAGVLQRG